MKITLKKIIKGFMPYGLVIVIRKLKEKEENTLKKLFTRVLFGIKYSNDRRLYSTMEDGLLRIRITHRCNARCRYCGQQFWTEDIQKMDMDSKILYEYAKPLYEKIKIILLTGGDPLFSKESIPYCRYISTNYPKITIFLESNGIAFSEEWRQLSMENLMRVHISLKDTLINVR